VGADVFKRLSDGVAVFGGEVLGEVSADALAVDDGASAPAVASRDGVLLLYA
jgi:hypothetical protein